jgi:hypothetical protein
MPSQVSLAPFQSIELHIAASQQNTARNSFDHLVGGREQRDRHGEVEHPGGLGVDDQLEIR